MESVFTTTEKLALFASLSVLFLALLAGLFALRHTVKRLEFQLQRLPRYISFLKAQDSGEVLKRRRRAQQQLPDYDRDFEELIERLNLLEPARLSEVSERVRSLQEIKQLPEPAKKPVRRVRLMGGETSYRDRGVVATKTAILDASAAVNELPKKRGRPKSTTVKRKSSSAVKSRTKRSSTK